MKQFFSLLITIFLCLSAYAHVSGVVLDDKGELLVGANVYWANTSKGTITDLDGKFELEPVKSTKQLVVSYMGYHNDTTLVNGHAPLTIVLVSDLILDEVTITERKMSVVRSRLTAFDTQTLDGAELCKAACCNLSEAFETNASVDVAYADAATGAKTIRLLGLSGTYVQLLNENTPGVRGLAQNFGMEYIPGPWMSSIQVSKGTSSVINGYEATTGQINVEFLKPQTQDPVAVNVMLNSELMTEVNVEGGWEIPLAEHHHEAREHNGHVHKDKLYTGILAHYQQGFMTMDENGDGFTEMPTSRNANLANRWFFKHDNYTFQAYVRGLYDKREGGQRPMTFHKNHALPATPYEIDLTTWRVDGFLKNGIVLDEETGSSIGIIAAASYHDQLNYYGHREWDASQANAYLNAIYQGNFEGSERLGMDNDHRLSAGFSLNYDKYNETLLPADTLGKIDLSRQEVTPGIFAEYSLKLEEMLSLVAGVRADYSSRYGFFFTPRVNVRYSPAEWMAVRASVGLGYRSPNVIADNAYMLPSSRLIDFSGMQWVRSGFGNYAKLMTESPAQERAVNTGVSTTFYIPVASRQLSITAEYYYTNFLNCVVADMDMNRNQVVFYNLQEMPTNGGAGYMHGRSFAHNAQVEASMEILRGWTMTAAFRYTDVEQTTFSVVADNYVLRQKPLTNKFKGIITTSYQTPLKKWQFDLTAQFNGGGRMPDGFTQYFLGTEDNPHPVLGVASAASQSQYYEKEGNLYYKWYPQLMAQITKYWRTCSLYLGAENMTNFRQANPVIGADDPFGANFDASMAWGPITGWKVYLGFRWSLGRSDED